MSKKSTTILGILAFLFVSSTVSYLVYERFKYMTDTTLAEDVVLTSDWTEFDVEAVLSPIWQENNIVYLAVNPSYRAFDFQRGITAPDGKRINAEIEAIDSEGNVYEFRLDRGRRTSLDMAGFTPHPAVPKGAKIKKLRIKADHSFPIVYVLWSSYDSKDLP